MLGRYIATNPIWVIFVCVALSLAVGSAYVSGPTLETTNEQVWVPRSAAPYKNLQEMKSLFGDEPDTIYLAVVAKESAGAPGVLSRQAMLEVLELHQLFSTGTLRSRCNH